MKSKKVEFHEEESANKILEGILKSGLKIELDARANILQALFFKVSEDFFVSMGRWVSELYMREIWCAKWEKTSDNLV